MAFLTIFCTCIITIPPLLCTAWAITNAPDIAFIRATTCDSEGYATFEDEVMYLDALVIAQAVHNNGGIVMMQVQKMVKK
ncbi:CoA-transferase, partial [Escherichia coli]